MRYSAKYPNVAHTAIDMRNPDHAQALWLMHHATLALMDALRDGNRQECEALRPLVHMFHERIDNVTAFQFT